MNGNFVSDVSSSLLNHYNNNEFGKIQVAIQNEIERLASSDDSDDYDSAYRLQQDIAFLNANLLTTISKYINTNVNSDKAMSDDKNTTQRDTFKAQNKSSKVNLSYKYFYLFVKMIVIILLLGVIYFYFFMGTHNISNRTRTSFNIGKRLGYNK